MLIERVRTVLKTPRYSRQLRAALTAAVFAAAFAGNAPADEYLGQIGGRGGGGFQARCAGGELLAGFELRAADDVDALRPLCVRPEGPTYTSAASYSDWHGGGGGRSVYVVCPRHIPIVTGIFVAAEGMDTLVVNNIHLFCGFITNPQVPSNAESIKFDAPTYENDSLYRYSKGTSDTQHCPDDLVGVGVHGRSGLWLDAIGLICDALPVVAVVPPPIEINPSSTSIRPERAISALASNASLQTTSRSTTLDGSAASRAAVAVPAISAPSPALDPRQIDRGSVARESPLADGSIRVEVRYPTAYGYQYANARGISGDLGIYSCDAFAVNYTAPPQDVEQHGLIGITTGMPMRRVNDEYICDTVISNLPRDQPVVIRAAMSGHRTSASDVWLDGSTPRPGRQQVRTISDGKRQVVLTADQPSAVLRFDMVYK